MKWRWSGTMNRVGDGTVEADTHDEALRAAMRQLYTNGAPDHEIDLEPIEETEDDI